MGEGRCSNPDLSTMHSIRTCDGTGLSAEWDDRCTTLLLLCSGWQQVCVERKCLAFVPLPTKMHLGPLPGSGLPSGNRLWHREYLHLLSRCPDHRILGVGQTTCSARLIGRGKGRGGERWHSRWTLPPKCSGRPCATPSSATRSGT